jgi:hypothetical protein
MPRKSAKPPKPEGIEAVPRHKKKGQNKTGIDAALIGVRSLIGADPSPEHFSELFEQLKAEKNDRGAAILAATNTENALRYALTRRTASTAAEHDGLFGLSGPMGTFDLKIRMGRALKIFGQETKTNLDIIRTIRNVFAHAGLPIRFQTREIHTLCNFLVVPFALPPKTIRVVDGKIIPPEDPTEPRARFNTVCDNTAHNLLLYGTHCFQKPRTNPEWERYDAWLTPKSLP